MNPYPIHELEGARLLCLNSSRDLEEQMLAVSELRLDGIVCNTAKGWDPWRTPLADLIPYKLNSLAVFSTSTVDLAAISKMPGLRFLFVAPDASGVDLRPLRDLTYLGVGGRPRFPEQLSHLRSLATGEVRLGGPAMSRNLTYLPPAPNLERLAYGSSNIKSLEGLDRYPSLERLQVSACRSLDDIRSIASICGTLSEVQFSHTPKILDYGVLGACAGLRGLYIQNNKLNSIEFVRTLPGLRVLNLGLSTVLDGDLRPAVGIDWVIVSDRRGHSHRLADLNPDAAAGLVTPEQRHHGSRGDTPRPSEGRDKTPSSK